MLCTCFQQLPLQSDQKGPFDLGVISVLIDNTKDESKNMRARKFLSDERQREATVSQLREPMLVNTRSPNGSAALSPFSQQFRFVWMLTPYSPGICWLRSELEFSSSQSFFLHWLQFTGMSVYLNKHVTNLQVFQQRRWLTVSLFWWSLLNPNKQLWMLSMVSVSTHFRLQFR